MMSFKLPYEIRHSRDDDLNFHLCLYPLGQSPDLLEQVPAKNDLAYVKSERYHRLLVLRQLPDILLRNQVQLLTHYAQCLAYKTQPCAHPELMLTLQTPASTAGRRASARRTFDLHVQLPSQ